MKQNQEHSRPDYTIDVVRDNKHIVYLTRNKHGEVISKDVRYFHYETIPLGARNDNNKRRLRHNTEHFTDFWG